MKATILIPNFNNEAFIIECLESIKAQTYKDFKILIIDDGSTDKSIELIEKFADNRIEIHKKNINTGIIDTLNIGLSMIQSEYIIRMDGDDVMHQERVEKLINFMDKNPEFGVCGSGIQHFGISNKTVIYEKDPLKNKTNLIFSHSIGHASVVYRNEVLKKHNIRYSNGYNYIEDYKIFYDLSKVTSITSIPDVLYFYRREEYNNYKNIDIKKNGNKKIYKDILTSLNFNKSEEYTEIHYQLFHNSNISYSDKILLNHLKLLEKKNRKLNKYDKTDIKRLLTEVKSKLFFRLVDQNKLSIISLIIFSISTPSKFYYYLKK